MIPASYTTLAAVVFVVGGLLTCFAGFRLFRIVLALYGFFAGAMIGSHLGGDPGNAWAVAMYGLVGGVVGAALMVVAYFVGVGLIGAGLAALALNVAWKAIGGEPPTILLVVVCVVGAVLALNVVRYVVVFGSAIAGSWTALVGGLAIMGNPRALKAASAPGIWVVYPIDMVPHQWWVMGLWFLLAVAGVAVQLSTSTKTGGKKRKKRDAEKK
jgi:hypothetical protein